MILGEGGPQSSVTGALIRSCRYTQRTASELEGREEVILLQSQETPKIAKKHQVLGEGHGRDFPVMALGRNRPCGQLDSDFQVLNCEKQSSAVSHPVVVLGCGSPRKTNADHISKVLRNLI